jgi:hypothetical protein
MYILGIYSAVVPIWLGSNCWQPIWFRELSQTHPYFFYFLPYQLYY